jgi:tetratricopeptide (TPR) repeat protein
MLIGRKELCDSIHTFLDQSKHVLLHGLAGAGKTALAATIADEHITAGKGSVIWLQPGREGAARILDALVMRLATEKEKPELIRLAGDAQIVTVSNLLARSGAGLLVLDNAWDGRALYCVRKAVPDGLPLLVTARHIFPLDELVEVGDLSDEAATELLAHHAGQAGLRADARARLLCEELGYHAYAIEIAGATLKVDQQTPLELCEQIHDAPHKLRMPEGLTEEGRDSVKRLLDDSVDRLNAELTELFRAFGALFAPGATAALLATCQDRPRGAVEENLKQLVRRSLARRSPGTDFYFLHDLTFRYARAMVEDGGVTHGEMAAAVQRYVEDQARDFDRLALDQNNILAAARVALTQNVDAMVSIVSVLATSGYLDVRGHTSELAQLLDETIKVVEQQGTGESELLHYLWSKRGNIHFDRGELDEACQAYQAALELAPNDSRRVILPAVLGKVYSELGRRDEADRHFQQGHELARAVGDERALAFLLQQQSFAAGRRGDFEKAREAAAQAVEISRHLKPHQATRTGYALINLGSAEYQVGVHQALKLHQEAYEIAVAQGALDLMAAASYALGSDYQALSRYDEARKHLDEALKLFRESGNSAEEIEVTIFMKDNGYRVT